MGQHEQRIIEFRRLLPDKFRIVDWWVAEQDIPNVIIEEIQATCCAGDLIVVLSTYNRNAISWEVNLNEFNL